jgi:Transposase DDE domain
MMGRQTGDQSQLFYLFNLERRIPAGHFTPEFATSRDERKKVEMRFAHLKTHHRFERLRLRGLSGARDEFHLAAIVQNLKTLACQLWQPPPGTLATNVM